MEEEVSLAQVGLVGLDENRLHAEAAKGEAPQYARLHSLDVDREQIDARASTQQARQHFPGVHAPASGRSIFPRTLLLLEPHPTHRVASIGLAAADDARRYQCAAMALAAGAGVVPLLRLKEDAAPAQALFKKEGVADDGRLV